MTLADEKKDVNQWRSFSYFVRLVNAVAYEKLALSSEEEKSNSGEHWRNRMSNSLLSRLIILDENWKEKIAKYHSLHPSSIC